MPASLRTFAFPADGDVAELVFTHQRALFEGGDGPGMREDGWRKILDRLPDALTR